MRFQIRAYFFHTENGAKNVRRDSEGDGDCGSDGTTNEQMDKLT